MIDNRILILKNKKIQIILTVIIFVLFFIITVILILSPKIETKIEVVSSQKILSNNESKKRNLEDILKNIDTFQITNKSSTDNTEECPSYNLSQYQQFFKNLKNDSYFSNPNFEGYVLGEFYLSNVNQSTTDKEFLNKFKENLNSDEIKKLEFTSSCSGAPFNTILYKKDFKFLDYESARLYVVAGQQFVPIFADQVNLNVLVFAFNSKNEYLNLNTTLNPLNFINNDDLRICRVKREQMPTSYPSAVMNNNEFRTTSDDYDYLDIQCVYNESLLKNNLELNSNNLVRNLLDKFFK